ncbi:MAG TPA: choice-of-anchor D domain-containing protein [Tepidisphaeraceae bacterium]|nr:choice-of-anchor D domain-containing protein [Tepidisphaeraceae bacterium]
MFDKIVSGLRLRRATASVIERLEDRRLMAADASAVHAMPLVLEFDQSAGGILDRDGQGTGFSGVQAINGGNAYQPALIDLDPVTGLLKITAKGTASAGSNFEADSSMKNGLETKFDATVAGGFSIGVRLVGPLSNFTGRNDQAGISFGPDQDNYIKLVAINVGGKQYIQFIDEMKVGSTYVHSVAVGASYTSIGKFSDINSLDLVMHGNAATGKVSAYFSINGGPLTKVSHEVTLSGRKRADFFSGAATAGLAVVKKNNDAADFTATFDRFETYAGQPVSMPAPSTNPPPVVTNPPPVVTDPPPVVTNPPPVVTDPPPVVTNPPPVVEPPVIVRPTVTAVSPAANATNVSPMNTTVTVKLNLGASEIVDASTLTNANVGLYRASDNTRIETTVALASDGTLVLGAVGLLQENTTYTVVVTDGLKNEAGTAFMPYSATFTTGLTPVKIAVSGTKYYFNDVRLTSGTNVAGAAQAITITNTGTAALVLNAGDAFTLSGANADQFVLLNKPSGTTTVQPGQSFKLNVAMNATSLGLKTATLTIVSNDPLRPTITVALRGLGTAGVGGNNEPSLQAILDLYEIPVNTGDSNPATTALYSATELLSNSEEIAGMERLLRANTALPVTITPLAVMGVSSSPVLTFGYYDPGTTGAKTALFTVGNADAQSVAPTISGITSFTPAGTKSFGLYATWPGFKNADNLNFRDSFSEDALNTWATQNTHKFRFYPMKTADGAVVANSYIVAAEDFDGSYDSNDIVFIISNVQPAAAGPEIGVKSNDNVGFDNRLLFHRIGTQNATIGDVVRDVNSLRIRNTGSQDLTISNVTVPSGWILLDAPTQPIAPGAFYDLKVQFVFDGGNSASTRSGTLTFNTNDADEPSVSVTLAGRYQVQSENDREPNLQAIFNLFGYRTQALSSGQSFTANKGKVEAFGDEVLSPYWQQADSQRPVQVRQLAAFHTQGSSATIRRHTKGSTSLTSIVTHDNREAQSILPHRSSTGGTLDAFGSFNATGTFGFNLDGEWSDDTLNPQEKPGGGYGHHVRFYVAKDASGNVIPNTYLAVMDYRSINYDFQDNVYLISNVKPEGPAVPTGLAAVPTNEGIALDWTDNAARNLAGYNVYRGTTGNGTYAKVNDAPLTVSQFHDTTAPSGQAVYYRVTAIDTFGTESAVAAISGSWPSDAIPPNTPTGLAAVESSGGVSLTWSANADVDLAGYDVYRSSAANGTFTKLNATLLTGTSYADTTAPVGATSYYRLVAVDTAGLNSTPALTNATTPVQPVAPAQPTNLMFTSSINGITLDWDDNPEANLTGYNVYFATSANGTYEKLNDALLTSSFFSHTTAPTGIASYYRVAAVNVNGLESAFAIGRETRME